jgi:hypothetical protein
LKCTEAFDDVLRKKWTKELPGSGKRARWVIQIEIDGVPYTERDYADVTCSLCGATAFVRTCAHGEAPPVRVVDGAAYCLACRS